MECAIYQTVDQIGISSKKIKEMVFVLLKEENADGDISLHFIGDKKMKYLNNKHRKKNKTTDVLSFASRENATQYDNATDLGDIFIDIPHIRRQAKEWDVNYENELLRMIIHGALHILGYDHIQKKDAKKMFDKQELYLKKYI